MRRDTSLLKTWLFEHVAHPYPSEAEKFDLCARSGLTYEQLSNYFVNARGRLLKREDAPEMPPAALGAASTIFKPVKFSLKHASGGSSITRNLPIGPPTFDQTRHTP